MIVAGFLSLRHPARSLSLHFSPGRSGRLIWTNQPTITGGHRPVFVDATRQTLSFTSCLVESGPICTAASLPRQAYFGAVKRTFRMHRLDSLYAALRAASPRVRAVFLLGSPASLPHSFRPALPSNLRGSRPPALQTQLARLWIDAVGEWAAQQRPR